MTAKLINSVFTGLLIFIIIGCAASESTRTSASYRGNLGNATQPDIERQIPLQINRFNFVMFRNEMTMDGGYYETEWKERELFDDEKALGVTDARTRFIISSRNRTAQASSLHNVRIEFENQVRYAGSEEWVAGEITDELGAYFRDVERRIRTELESGVRRN